jgi:hypothetical protein
MSILAKASLDVFDFWLTIGIFAAVFCRRRFSYACKTLAFGRRARWPSAVKIWLQSELLSPSCDWQRMS